MIRIAWFPEGLRIYLLHSLSEAWYLISVSAQL